MRKAFTVIPAAVIIGYMAMLSPAQAADTQFFLSTGYNFSQGDYGRTSKTIIDYAPVSLRAQAEHWSVKVTVPYLRIRGTGIGLDGEQTGAPASPETADGLGTVQLGVGYRHALNNYGTTGDVQTRFEFPTANDKRRLGTGKASQLVQVGLSQTIGNSFFISGNVGRKFSSSSARYPLYNTWKGGASVGVKLMPSLTMGVGFDYRTPSTATAHPYEQITTYAQYKFSPSFSVQTYVGAGLTRAAPALSTGFEVTRKLDILGSPRPTAAKHARR